MPALRYSEDTEFNDALRARGILPPLPTRPESPPEESRPTPTAVAEQLIDRLDSQRSIDELELDDQLPTSLIDEYKSNRIAQLSRLDRISNSRSSTGGLIPIGRQDYVREVNEASQLDVDPDSKLARKGTGVVVCLWNNSLASKHLLSLLERLSHQYPSTRFLSIPGSSCIDNYPDINQPTMICYRAGMSLRQYVGIGTNTEISKTTNGRLGRGLSTEVEDLEAELLSIGILDEHLKLKSSYPQASSSSSAHDPHHQTSSDDDSLDGDRLSRGPRSIIRSKTDTLTRINRSKDDSDSELDI